MADTTEIVAKPGGCEIIISRVFNAPREKVWLAYTEADLFKQWIGPRRLQTRIDTWELEPGGKWAFTNIDEDGSLYSFHGYYHEVTPRERIIQTFEYDAWPSKVSLETAAFEELAGDKTKVTSVSVFQSPEDRDGMLKSGMEKGVREGNEKLDELLEKL